MCAYRKALSLVLSIHPLLDQSSHRESRGLKVLAVRRDLSFARNERLLNVESRFSILYLAREKIPLTGFRAGESENLSSESVKCKQKCKRMQPFLTLVAFDFTEKEKKKQKRQNSCVAFPKNVSTPAFTNTRILIIIEEIN